MRESPIRRASVLALGAMAFVAAAFQARTERMQVQQAVAMQRRSPTGEDVGSTRNGGRRGGNRAYQRAAQKRRNVLRHRKACRG